MIYRLVIKFTFVLFVSASHFAFSQQTEVDQQNERISDLKKSIDILSGILIEGLELNESSTPFGVNQGRVKGVYLQGQGVVLEIDTPLAARRNRVGLNAFAFSLRELSDQPNPFSFMRDSIAQEPDRSMLYLNQGSGLGEIYQNMLEEIRTIDLDSIVSESLRKASSSARSLREIGEIDEASFTNLRQELDTLRESLAERKEELSKIETRLAQQSATNGLSQNDADVESDLRNAIDQMKFSLEQIKSNASDKAMALSAQYEIAKAQLDEQWRLSVVELEDQLYGLLCDYGATLRNLPDEERLTVILSGMGERADDDSTADKIHVLNKVDLSECQSGVIGREMLHERAINYIY